MPFILYDVVFFNRLPDTGINSLMSRGTEQPSKFLNDAMYPLMPNGLLGFKFVDMLVLLASVVIPVVIVLIALTVFF